MIIVTNKTSKPVRCAAIEFVPGENKFNDADLSPGKLAQVKNHRSLKHVSVEDRAVESKAKGAK